MRDRGMNVAVSKLMMESEPLELHRRGASLSTIETASGSYSVGRIKRRELPSMVSLTVTRMLQFLS